MIEIALREELRERGLMQGGFSVKGVRLVELWDYPRSFAVLPRSFR